MSRFAMEFVMVGLIAVKIALSIQQKSGCEHATIKILKFNLARGKLSYGAVPSFNLVTSESFSDIAMEYETDTVAF